jgi:hypothetical protein
MKNKGKNSDSMRYLSVLGSIIIYHVVMIYFIYIHGNLPHSQQVLGTGFLLLCNIIFISYVFKIPHQKTLCQYKYVYKGETKTVSKILFEVGQACVIGAGVSSVLIAFIIGRQELLDLVYNWVSTGVVSFNAIIFGLCLLAFPYCYFVVYGTFKVLREFNLIQRVKNFKIKSRSAKKVRLFFKKTSNIGIFPCFLGGLTYIRSNTLCVALLYITSIRFTSGALLSLALLILLLSLFVCAIPQTRNYMTHNYGKKSLRLLGYNYNWELFFEKTLQNVTKAVTGVGSSLIFLDVYETTAHGWDI